LAAGDDAVAPELARDPEATPAAAPQPIVAPPDCATPEAAAVAATEPRMRTPGRDGCDAWAVVRTAPTAELLVSTGPRLHRLAGPEPAALLEACGSGCGWELRHAPQLGPWLLARRPSPQAEVDAGQWLVLPVDGEAHAPPDVAPAPEPAAVTDTASSELVIIDLWEGAGPRTVSDATDTGPAWALALASCGERVALVPAPRTAGAAALAIPLSLFAQWLDLRTGARARIEPPPAADACVLVGHEP